MSEHDWNDRYTAGDRPWDTGAADTHLIEIADGRPLWRGPALEIGCGTGTNAVWMARAGFDVLGVDLASQALEEARTRAQGVAGCRFQQLDFLREPTPGGPYTFAYDRGCFHVFDDAADRAEFARRVAAALGPDGLWLSLIGSTEGPARDFGPPRRSASDVIAAIEPVLEIVELRTTEFVAKLPAPARAWLCLARRRRDPAQPSTRR